MLERSASSPQAQGRVQPAQLLMVSLFWLLFHIFAVLYLETPLLLSAVVLPNPTVTSFVLFCLSLRTLCLVFLISSVLLRKS